MQALWLTWVLPVLLTGVWVAIAIIEWQRSRDPAFETYDWQSSMSGGLQS